MGAWCSNTVAFQRLEGVLVSERGLAKPFRELEARIEASENTYIYPRPPRQGTQTMLVIFAVTLRFRSKAG